MQQVIGYIDGLSPFIQGLLGTALFAFSSWVFQQAFKRAKTSGSVFFREYSKLDMVRHVVHRYYVNSNDFQRSSYGATIALLFAARWILIGILIVTFIVGIDALLNGRWLFLAASWLCFNCFLEAYNWVKDTSDEKSIAHVADDIKEEILTQLVGTPQPVKIENGDRED